MIFGGGVRPTMVSVAIAGLLAADQGENLADEESDTIDVRQPVHGADEDEVGWNGRGGVGGGK